MLVGPDIVLPSGSFWHVAMAEPCTGGSRGRECIWGSRSGLGANHISPALCAHSLLGDEGFENEGMVQSHRLALWIQTRAWRKVDGHSVTDWGLEE